MADLDVRSRKVMLHKMSLGIRSKLKMTKQTTFALPRAFGHSGRENPTLLHVTWPTKAIQDELGLLSNDRFHLPQTLPTSRILACIPQL
jgi:hypothetical protein